MLSKNQKQCLSQYNERQIPCPCPSQGSAKSYRNLSFAVLLGIAGFTAYTFTNIKEHDPKLNPETIKPYEYLRRRTRDDAGFAWGKESLFFNPHTNVSEAQWKESLERIKEMKEAEVPSVDTKTKK